MGLGPSQRWRERRWVKDNIEYYNDEWGNVWHRVTGMSKGGELYKPALEDWSMLADFELPNLVAPKRFKAARNISWITLMTSKYLNAYECISAENILFTKSAIQKFQEELK